VEAEDKAFKANSFLTLYFHTKERPKVRDSEVTIKWAVKKFYIL